MKVYVVTETGPQTYDECGETAVVAVTFTKEGAKQAIANHVLRESDGITVVRSGSFQIHEVDTKEQPK